MKPRKPLTEQQKDFLFMKNLWADYGHVKGAGGFLRKLSAKQKKKFGGKR